MQGAEGRAEKRRGLRTKALMQDLGTRLECRQRVSEGYSYTMRFIAPILLYSIMLRYCANLKAIRYESTSFNRIVADKSHRVIAA